MFAIHPFLLLVLAGFATFMIVLLVVSLRCWTSDVPRASTDRAVAPPASRDTGAKKAA